MNGHVRDAAGKAVVGARIDLGGAAQAVRYTDFTGGYAFHVNAGNYTLTPSAPCTVSPLSATKSVQSNTTQDFAVTTAGCAVSSQSGVEVSLARYWT